MQESFKLATERSEVEKELQKSQSDHKVCGATVQVGDHVLAVNVAFQGTHKLADHWQEEVNLS